MEGTCSGRYGYVVAVMNLQETSEGRIREGTGFATFRVKFQALLYRPFKFEVVQATVVSLSKVRSAQTPVVPISILCAQERWTAFCSSCRADQHLAKLLWQSSQKRLIIRLVL